VGRLHAAAAHSKRIRYHRRERAVLHAVMGSRLIEPPPRIRQRIARSAGGIDSSTSARSSR
jgi:hypothetical protein